MNPYTRAHVTIPEELSESARIALVRNLQMLYQAKPRGHPSSGRYVISTRGEWELEIETKLRNGIDYHGRLSIHCFSPERRHPARSSNHRRTHHWY